MSVHVPSYDAACVLVAGDLMLDRYWVGDSSRISPEAPVPVVRVSGSEERAGGAGNVALNIASLGGQAIVVGVTGRDEPADQLQALLESAGVECLFDRIKDFTTVTKLRVLSRHQQLIRLDFEDGTEPSTQGMLERFEQTLGRCDVVVLSDYGKGTLTDPQPFIKAARSARKPVLVDPKGHEFERYRQATMITPNLAEFEAVVGPCADEAELVRKGEALVKQLKVGGLLITRSEQGMTLLQKGKKAVHLGAHAREVFDVTGAGDTVIAVLAASLAAGLDFPGATSLANTAAGVVVGKLGTGSVTVHELRRGQHDSEDTGYGLVSQEQLIQVVEDARAHGETIVMTNGCFDVLHAGHVGYLEEARRLGDRLIVAVNDDDSVRRLKGADRPLNNVEQRMAVLASLSAVDWVVPFSEDTPESLICRTAPDVLAKGGDYRVEDIAGHECVLERGGRVEILAYREGYSTSGFIDRVRNKDSGDKA